jgi:hypothetical protein
MCYSRCENSCSESNDLSEYIRDRVGDFCADTPATYTAGRPGCNRHAVTKLDRSTNLMATRRKGVPSLTPHQNALARCWLINWPHHSFVKCKKTIKVQYSGNSLSKFENWKARFLLSVRLTHITISIRVRMAAFVWVATTQSAVTAFATGYCGKFCDLPTSSLDRQSQH